MNESSSKKSLDKCSFCGKKDDNELFLENDSKTACICQDCAGMLAAYVSDKERDDQSGAEDDFTESSKTIVDMVMIYKCSEDFTDLIKSVGIEDDLLSGFYYKNDPRSENIGVGVFESQLKLAIENNPSSIKQLIKKINDFFLSPDLYNFWKYALLAKHLNYLSNYEMDIEDEIPSHWAALERFGVDLDSCIQVLTKLNSAVESEEINTEDYQNGLQTVIACYLALAIWSGGSNRNVEKLIHLAACNDEIDGISISENTSHGWGEHAVSCRRMLEEFTDVCIEAPEGVDLEADGYFDYIDWDDVADKIMQALA